MTFFITFFVRYVNKRSIPAQTCPQRHAMPQNNNPFRDNYSSFSLSSLSAPAISNHPVMPSTQYINFQYKLALPQSNSPASVLGTWLPIISLLTQPINGIFAKRRCVYDFCGSSACSAGRSLILLAVGMRLQNMGEFSSWSLVPAWDMVWR